MEDTAHAHIAALVVVDGLGAVIGIGGGGTEGKGAGNFVIGMRGVAEEAAIDRIASIIRGNPATTGFGKGLTRECA